MSERKDDPDGDQTHAEAAEAEGTGATGSSDLDALVHAALAATGIAQDAPNAAHAAVASANAAARSVEAAIQGARDATLAAHAATQAAQAATTSALAATGTAEVATAAAQAAAAGAPTPQALDDDLSITLEMWKQTVSVQMHFNDIEMRIRNLAITVVGAFLAALAFVIEGGLFWGGVSAGVLLMGGAIIAVIDFWFMDRLWYHRLLQSAVNRGIEQEQRIKSKVADIKSGLTEKIKEDSPFNFFGIEVHSERKIDILYGFLLAVVVTVLVVVWVTVQPEDGEGAASTPAATAIATP
jgi:hypothetical protein